MVGHTSEMDEKNGKFLEEMRAKPAFYTMNEAYASMKTKGATVQKSLLVVYDWQLFSLKSVSLPFPFGSVVLGERLTVGGISATVTIDLKWAKQ